MLFSSVKIRLDTGYNAWISGIPTLYCFVRFWYV